MKSIRLFSLRCASLLLSLLLLLSTLVTFVSCGNENDDDPPPNVLPPDAWYNPANGFPEDGFGGRELVIRMSENTRAADVGSPSGIEAPAKYMQGPSDRTPDDVLNMCYDRNKKAAAVLNLKIRYAVEPAGIALGQIAEELQDHVLLSSAPFDVIVSDVYPVASLALSGSLYNVKKDYDPTDTNYGAKKNYFDFRHEAWYNEYMNGTTLDENKRYCVAGDYFIDVLRSAHGIYVNTEYFNEICSTIHMDSVSDLYALISEGDGEAGGWTYDNYRILIEAAWRPTGVGGVTTKEDGIGLLINVDHAVFPLVYSAGFSMIKKTGNSYAMETDVSQLSRLASAVFDLTKNTNGVLYTNRREIPDFRKPFTEGKVLFLGGYWLGDLEHRSFHEMPNKSVVVYPKWDETKINYSTYIHHSAEVGYILKNTATFTAASAYLQYLNEESVKMIGRYYEIALKYKYSTDPDPMALEMLDLIHDSFASPFDELIGMQIGCDLKTLIKECEAKKDETAAYYKYIANRDTNFKTRLDHILSTYAGLT